MTITRVLPWGLSRQLADNSAGAITSAAAIARRRKVLAILARFNRKPRFSKRLDISRLLFYWSKAVVGVE